MFSITSSFPRQLKVFKKISSDSQIEIANENLIFTVASTVLQGKSRSSLTLRKGISLFLPLQGHLYVLVPASALASILLLKLVKLLRNFLVFPEPCELPALR